MLCICLWILQIFLELLWQVRFVIMGNLFCTEHAIHRRFDLKGSSHGRTTEKPESEIDPTTTLKDLDLNYIFRLQRFWFQEFCRWQFPQLTLWFLSVDKSLFTIWCFWPQERLVQEMWMNLRIRLKQNIWVRSGINIVLDENRLIEHWC